MVDLHGKYYDGHYSHARMIQKLLSFELWDYLAIETYQHRELSVARLNSSEAELLLVRLSCLIRLESWRWWLITTWALVIWAELRKRFKLCWRRKLRSMGSLVLSFRWGERYLCGWCSFLWGFLENLAFAGRREVARWTVFAFAECRESARWTASQFAECRALARWTLSQFAVRRAGARRPFLI